jgi:hypothetical protein
VNAFLTQVNLSKTAGFFFGQFHGVTFMTPFRRGSSLVWTIAAGSSLKNQSSENQFHYVKINRQKQARACRNRAA